MLKHLIMPMLALILLIGCMSNRAHETDHTRITHSSWGKTTIQHPDGSRHEYEDVKVWPTGSRAWDWKEHNTHHVPGVQIADVEELLDTASIIILSRGMDKVLQVPQATVDYVARHNKIVHVLRTQDAVTLFNKLSTGGKRVAGLFHSTC